MIGQASAPAGYGWLPIRALVHCKKNVVSHEPHILLGTEMPVSKQKSPLFVFERLVGSSSLYGVYYGVHSTHSGRYSVCMDG